MQKPTILVSKKVKPTVLVSRKIPSVLNGPIPSPTNVRKIAGTPQSKALNMA